MTKRDDQHKAKLHGSSAPFNHKTVSDGFQHTPHRPFEEEMLRKAFGMISVTEPRADQLITSQELIFDSTKKHHAHFVPTGAGKSAIYLAAALALRARGHLCSLPFGWTARVSAQDDQRVG